MLRRAAASRAAFRVQRREIESDSGQKERNWKVDQDNVLRMFRQQGGLGDQRDSYPYSTTTLPVIFG